MYFISKFFKNGLKYKFVKSFKKSLIIVKIIKRHYKKNLNQILFSKFIFLDEILHYVVPRYITKINIKRKKRKTMKKIESYPLESSGRIKELLKI